MLTDKIRVAVFASGGGTDLQSIIDAQEAGRLSDGEISLVICNRKSPYARTRAENHGIPAFVVTKMQTGSQEAFEREILRLLEENRIDLIVLAGFLSILSEDFIRHFPRRIINIHPSLIPSFCGDGYYGLRVHEEALKYGVKVSGATVHYVNEVTDGGEIIMQKAVTVRKGDTPETLQRRIMEQAEWKILPKAVEQVCRELRKGNGKKRCRV